MADGSRGNWGTVTPTDESVSLGTPLGFGMNGRGNGDRGADPVM